MLADELLDFWQLAGEDERVERDVALEAAAVQLGHELGQLGDVEVLRAGAGVEAGVEAEIDRVGAVFDRGADAVAIAGGGEEFGAGWNLVSHLGSLAMGRRRKRSSQRLFFSRRFCKWLSCRDLRRSVDVLEGLKLSDRLEQLGQSLEGLGQVLEQLGR